MSLKYEPSSEPRVFACEFAQNVHATALYDPFKTMVAIFIQNHDCNVHFKKIAIFIWKKNATFIQNNGCNVVRQGRVQNFQDHTVDYAGFVPPKFEELRDHHHIRHWS